jgi:hypothetical protein
MMRIVTRGVALVALTMMMALGIGCSDANAPDPRPENALRALRLRSDAPPLEQTSASFYAKKGEAREVALYFTNGAGGRGPVYFRLHVGANSLGTLPDGTPIALGDSVLITVQVVDPNVVLFDLQPSGLRFNTADPAELSISYDEVDHDFDGDGDQDLTDQMIELQLAVWRQETLGGLFEHLTSVVDQPLDRVSASLAGFTRYAVSY